MCSSSRCKYRRVLNGYYYVCKQKPVRLNFRKFQNDVAFLACICTYATRRYTAMFLPSFFIYSYLHKILSGPFLNSTTHGNQLGHVLQCIKKTRVFECYREILRKCSTCPLIIFHKCIIFLPTLVTLLNTVTP